MLEPAGLAESYVTVPEIFVNSPRTFAIIMCRMLNCAEEWAGSIW
jgi:hypothetical protein